MKISNCIYYFIRYIDIIHHHPAIGPSDILSILTTQQIYNLPPILYNFNYLVYTFLHSKQYRVILFSIKPLTLFIDENN